VDDPFLAVADELTVAEGVSENADYRHYRALIDDFRQLGRLVDAVRVWLLFGELMRYETVSFADREGYTEEAYGSHLQELLEGAGLTERAALLSNLRYRLAGR
jgi:hypothetical protein